MGRLCFRAFLYLSIYLSPPSPALPVGVHKGNPRRPSIPPYSSRLGRSSPMPGQSTPKHAACVLLYMLVPHACKGMTLCEHTPSFCDGNYSGTSLWAAHNPHRPAPHGSHMRRLLHALRGANSSPHCVRADLTSPP